MKTIVALVLFSLLLSLGITSHAKTPDGKTPSEETVCDGQVGAAHGLCTAYCEAMDCDSDYPKASEKACARVQANFENITGEMLPCDLCVDVICPLGEECVEGECRCGEGPSCNVENQCVVNICDAATRQCEFFELVPDETPCDDGNVCTDFDICQVGVCEAVSNAPDGTYCDDGDECTQDDSCIAGICSGFPICMN